MEENKINNESVNLNETIKEEQTKPKKNKPILIVFLILIILGLVSYIMYDKLFVKEKPTPIPEVKEEPQVEKEDLSGVATALKHLIDTYKLDQLDREGKNIDDISILTNEQLLAFESYWYNGIAFNADENLLNQISKNNFDEYIKSAYGITGYLYKDIICPIDNQPLYTYDTNRNAYIKNVSYLHGHEGHYNESIYSRVYGIKRDNDNYVLELNKIYFEGPELGGPEIYADATKTTKLPELNKFITNQQGIDEMAAITYYEEHYNSFKEKLPRYRYTFSKNDDSYHLIKYEVVKEK